MPSKTQFLPEGGLSMFLRISTVVFVVSAIISGSLYLWKSALASSVADQSSTLDKLNVTLNPGTITELEHTADAISSARSLLTNHAKTSVLFDMLEQNTLPDVGYTSFQYTSDQHTINLSGQASSYSSVAAQTAILENLPNVSSATFSNLALQDTGGVNFKIILTLK